MLNLFCTKVCFLSARIPRCRFETRASGFLHPVLELCVVVSLFPLQNLSNEEQVVVIHARTVLTLAEKVRD